MTPINKLSADVLLEIFSYNATMNQDLPLFPPRRASAYNPTRYPSHPQQIHDAGTGLLSTRRTSQVCHSWREVLLAASSLWGRILNINYLRQGDGTWRKEVLARTGQAPLRIKGDLSFSEAESAEVMTMNEFFLSILENKWPRIQSLELQIHDGLMDSSRKTAKLLQRRAASLQMFDFSIIKHQWLVDTPCIMIPQLFSDHAPLLRTYHSSNLATFQPGKAWMANLRELSVYAPSSANFSKLHAICYSLQELLASLSNMKFLESISLSYPEAGRTTTPEDDAKVVLPVVCLPRLRSAAFRADAHWCYPFLQSLDISAPTAGWSLHIEGMQNTHYDSENEEIFSLSGVAAVLRTMLLYVEGYMAAHDVNNFTMLIEATYVELSHDPWFTTGNPKMGFGLESPPSPQFIGLLPSFVRELAKFRLSPVKHLTLFLFDILSTTTPVELAELLASLVGVVSLETTVPTLGAFNSLPPSLSGTFPLLREVRIAHPYLSTDFHPLVEFLSMRMANAELSQVVTVNFGEGGSTLGDQSAVSRGARALKESGFEYIKVTYRSSGGDRDYVHR